MSVRHIILSSWAFVCQN